MPIFLAIVAFVYLAFGLAYFGRRLSSYSHIEHTISEIGANGTEITKSVSLFLFLPVGIIAGLIAYYSHSDEAVVLFSLAICIGYIGSAFFPIDQGAPAFGSWKNTFHNLFGGIEYITALVAFEHVAQDEGFPYSVGKPLIIGFLVVLFIPFVRKARGLIQRVVEIGIFAGLIAQLSA